jgi:gliding motility-associated-like protein
MAFEVQANELFSGKVYNYEEQDEYLIQIEVESDYGDLYYDTLTIFINDLIEFDDLKVTNFMTPNEDGVNDYFVIPNPYLFEGYTLMIFNDNGNNVFTQESDYENDWNGLTNEGVELPSATYYYTFIQKGQEYNNFKGKITILRSSKF